MLARLLPAFRGGTSHAALRIAAVVAGAFDLIAELPRVEPATVVPTITGTTITLTDSGNAGTNGTNLQNAINTLAAADGALNHAVVLPAGVSFAVPSAGSYNAFTLPARTGTNAGGTGWILVKSSGSLPARGTRVTPNGTAALAQIALTATSSSDRVFKTAPNARHYWLMGLEAAHAAGSTLGVSGLIDFGDGGSDQTGAQPHDLVVDRCYLHGQADSAYDSTDKSRISRAVGLNCGSAVVVDSWISEIHSNGQDVQAIGGWNGTGPYLIQNNHLEAAGENILFGGADPWTDQLTPSDITVRANYMYKPARWFQADLGYSVKNLFEIKSAQRVLVENNVMEHHWNGSLTTVYVTHLAAGQDKAINIKSNNQGDSKTVNGGNGRFSNQGQYWSITRDVTVRYNIVRNACGAMAIAGNVSDNNFPTVGTSRVVVHDNLFYNVGDYAATQAPQYILSSSINATTLANVVLQNNTFHSNNANLGTVYGTDPSSGGAGTNFTFKDNIVAAASSYGFRSDGVGSGTAALNGFWGSGGWSMTGNVLVSDGTGAAYPAGNSFVGSVNAVGFNNLSSQDFSLGSGSVALTASTAGGRSGADVTTVLSRTLGVASGLLPASFSFAPVTGATAGASVTSASATISGLASGVSVQVSVSGGLIAKNGGSFGAGPVSVVNGDTIAVQVTASASPSGVVSATVTSGDVSAVFSVTTAASTNAVAANRVAGGQVNNINYAGTSSTLSAVPLAANAPDAVKDRLVVVVLSAASMTTGLFNCSIGGINARPVVQNNGFTPIAGKSVVGIFVRRVYAFENLQTGNVVVQTTAAGNLKTDQLTYEVYNLFNSAIVPANTYAFAGTSGNSANSAPALSITVPSEGVAIVAAANDSSATITASGITWDDTQVVPTSTDGNVANMSSAVGRLTASGTVTENNGAGQTVGLAAAAWGHTPTTPTLSYVGTSAVASTASGNLTLTEPANATSGDLLVATISYRGTGTFTVPSGWTLIAQDNSVSNTTAGTTASIGSTFMAYAVRGASASSYAFTRSGGDVAIGTVAAFRPEGTGTPQLDGTATSTILAAASATVTGTGLTTTAAHSLVVMGCCMARNVSASAEKCATQPVQNDWTETVDTGTATGAGAAVAFAFAFSPVAGATGAPAYTTTSARHGVVLAAFKVA